MPLATTAARRRRLTQALAGAGALAAGGPSGLSGLVGVSGLRGLVGVSGLPGLVGVSGLLGGCATAMAPMAAALRRSPPAGLPARVSLADATPFFADDSTLCGPSALAGVLAAAGAPVTPVELADQVYLPSRGGSLAVELLGATRRHGLLAVALPPRLDAVLQELAAGHPVLMLVNLSLPVWPRWHYLVAVGYDLPAGDALVHSGTERAARWPLETLELTWARGGPWAMVALAPGELPASAGPDSVWSALTALERLPPTSTAAPWWAAAHARWPEDLPLALGHANQLYAAGRWDAAARVYEAAAARHDSAVAWNNLAQLRWLQGRREAAQDAARQAWRRVQSAEPRWRDAVRATLGELGLPAP